MANLIEDLIIIAIPLAYLGAAFCVVVAAVELLEKFRPKLYEKIFKVVFGMTPDEFDDFDDDDDDDFWEEW